MLSEYDLRNILTRFASSVCKNNCAVVDRSNTKQNAYRSIYYDNAEHKFFEYIDFKNSNTKRAIAIGINPSMIEANNIDFTNKEIVSYLTSKGYGGYILLNLWSKRTESSYLLDCYRSSMIGRLDMQNDCSNFINDVLNHPNRSEDILLFWGQSYVNSHSVFNTNLTTTLNNLYSQCFYSAGSKGAFVHPSQKNKNKDSRFKSFEPLVIGTKYW